MKTFFKNNLIWVFALVLSIGTMSFNMLEKAQKSDNSTYWYQKDIETGNYSPASGPDPSCVENPQEICALGFDFEPNVTVTDALHDDAIERRYRAN